MKRAGLLLLPLGLVGGGVGDGGVKKKRLKSYDRGWGRLQRRSKGKKILQSELHSRT